jgi:hypothetical protein
MRPLVAKPTSDQVSDCRHIRNLHDVFSISSVALVAAAGASGVATIPVGSSGGKTALAITSVILGALGALALTGVSIETNDYISDYPSQGGCPAILGALDTPTPSGSDTGSTSVFDSGSKTSSTPGMVRIGGAGSAAINNVNTSNVQ